MRAHWIHWSLVSLFTAMPLAAQDTSRVALVMGANGPGVLLPLSSSTALRVSGSVSKTSTSDVDAWTEGVGVSALFYLQKWDALRTFVGPRITYSYSSVSGTPANTKAWSSQVFFGTEYALGRRFGAFGEVGVSYARSTGTRIGPANEAIPVVPTTVWSTTNGVGLLFRF